MTYCLSSLHLSVIILLSYEVITQQVGAQRCLVMEELRRKGPPVIERMNEIYIRNIIIIPKIFPSNWAG